jgi:hypothetical protein
MTDDLSRLSPFPHPENLPPMIREEFAFVFQLAHSAAGLAMPVENPAQFSVRLRDQETEEVTALQFTDIPINRAMFAAKKHFGKDIASFVNFSTRFLAMSDVMRSDAVKKWTKEDKTDSRITLLHPAVIYACAEARLDSKGQFDLCEFFDAVEKIAPTIPAEDP